MALRPTMHDVARLAGVSVTTVSRAVNNHTYVKPATRDRVNAAIAELGFQRNEIARTLRGRAAATVALVIEDVANPFYSAIARAVDEVAQERQHMLIVGNTRHSFERESNLLSEMVRRQVDGLLVVPTAQDHAAVHADLGRWVPMVFIDRVPTGIAADSVVLDNRGGTRKAIDHLASAGHERIAYIGGDPTVFTGVNRLAGYRQALKRRDLPYDRDLVRLGHHTVEAAQQATTDLLRRAEPPTAIFADNNRMTIGALQSVFAHGGGIDVAGFDDLELADLLTMQVALVTYRPDELGRAAANLLFERIEGKSDPPRKIVLTTELVLRGGARIAAR